MARRYDSSTTTFSPEGRLHQVEYAIEAINNAGTCVGILVENGVVLACETKAITTTKLLHKSEASSEKVYKVANHLTCSVAGLTADANILVDQARLKAARYEYSYNLPIPPENLVESVCNIQQSYTQYGGLRPFGVSFLFAGYDETAKEFQLYQSDPSGNYSGWKATVIGANSASGKSFLKNKYPGEDEENDEEPKGDEETKSTGPPTLLEGLQMAIKVLNKTMDGGLLTSAGNAADNAHEKLELFSLTRNEETGSFVHSVLKKDDIKKLVEQVMKQQEEEEKAAEESKMDTEEETKDTE